MAAFIAPLRKAKRRLSTALDPKCHEAYAKAAKTLDALEADQRRPLVVHCMPKVGSMTVIASLTALNFGDGAPIYRPHFYSPDGLKYELSVGADWFGGYENLPRKWYCRAEKNRAVADRVMTEGSRALRWKIITMVREPLANNVSSFFHNNHWWPDEIRHLVDKSPEIALEKLTQMFFERYPHDLPLQWFDLEVLPMYQLDVYSTEFPHGRGYQIFTTDKADILLLRLENLAQEASSAIHNFLGIENFELVNDNLAADKWYGDMYRRFMREIELPESYLDRIYQSKMAQHFYSDSELERFRARWSRRSPHCYL